MCFYSYWILFILDKYLGIELLGRIISVGLALQETVTCNSTRISKLYIPTHLDVKLEKDYTAVCSKWSAH